MTRVVAHGLGDVERARAAMERAYRNHADRLAGYSPTLTWSDPRAATMSLVVMTKTIRASFALDDERVTIESKFPYAFSFMEGQVLTKVCERLEEVFADARGSRS